jgi:hypothetical protein
MKIVTVCNFPPIPDRRWDWCAYADGHEEDGRYGYGRTEAEAVEDFIANYAEEYEDAERAQREREAEAAHNGGLSPLGNWLTEQITGRTLP